MAGKGRELEVLRRVPLFEGLTAKDLKVIHGATQEERFGPGSDMVKEGDPGGRFYVILSGEAKVVVGGKTRKTLKPGDYFGEMSLIDREPRAATVTATAEVRALSIASWNFLVLLEENWKLTTKVLSLLSKRVRELERSPAG